MFANDTLTTIQRTAVEAHGNRIIYAPAEPKHVYWLRDSQGELQKQHAEPEPAKHEPTNFESVVAIAKDADHEQDQSLWCSLSGVVAILSDDRRERATLKLTKSKQFAKLCEWDKAGVNGESLDHVTTYTLFRTLFRDSLPAHGTIRDDIRKVDIQKAQQAASDVSRTAVSMSKKLIAEASGADKLPDVLTFDVPVFAEAIAPIRVKIRVAFDLDPQQERFRFIVLPNEIETAVADAEAWVEKRIVDLIGDENTDMFPVYRGTP